LTWWSKLKKGWAKAATPLPNPFCWESDVESLYPGELQDWPPRWRAWAGRASAPGLGLVLEGPTLLGAGSVYYVLALEEGFWVVGSFLEVAGGRRFILPWEWMVYSHWGEPPHGEMLEALKQLEAAEIPYGNMAAVRGDHRIGLHEWPRLLKALSGGQREPVFLTTDILSPVLYVEGTPFGGLSHAGEAQLRALGLEPPPQLKEEVRWRRVLGPFGGEDGFL
jgi:hypothetical protein